MYFCVNNGIYPYKILKIPILEATIFQDLAYESCKNRTGYLIDRVKRFTRSVRKSRAALARTNTRKCCGTSLVASRPRKSVTRGLSSVAHRLSPFGRSAEAFRLESRLSNEPRLNSVVVNK